MTQKSFSLSYTTLSLFLSLSQAKILIRDLQLLFKVCLWSTLGVLLYKPIQRQLSLLSDLSLVEIDDEFFILHNLGYSAPAVPDEIRKCKDRVEVSLKPLFRYWVSWVSASYVLFGVRGALLELEFPQSIVPGDFSRDACSTDN